MNTLIRYNRSVKEYQLIDLLTGAIVATAPRGQEHKAALEVQQLQLEARLNKIDPAWLRDQVRDLVTRDWRLQGRAFRAALLLASAGVRRNGGAGHYLVDSQSQPGQVYQVCNNGRRACDCTDYANGLAGHAQGAPFRDGAPCCKHLLAADLLSAWQSHQRDTALPVERPRDRSRLFKT